MMMVLFVALCYGALQFVPGPIVVPDSAVVLANEGDFTMDGSSVPFGHFDGMGLMASLRNSSHAVLIVNTEGSPSLVFRLILEISWPFQVVSSTVLFNNSYDRLCSGTLAPNGLFFESFGSARPTYFSGEESSSGRAFAFFVDDDAPSENVLTSLGILRFENISPCPVLQNKTILCCTDDNSPFGFVMFYVGDKTDTGSDLDKMGLTGGIAYGLVIEGWSEGVASPPLGTRFSLVALDDLSGHTTRAQTAAELASKGATMFARPEG